jgi:hypothetical protein
MIGHSAQVLVALATMATAVETQVSSIAHRHLPVGQSFEIETTDQVFRGQLVDRSTGECQMIVSDDGKQFSPSRTVFLLGATAGPQGPQMLVRMHEVQVGLKMELGVDDLEQRNRLITSEVTQIKLLR